MERKIKFLIQLPVYILIVITLVNGIFFIIIREHVPLPLFLGWLAVMDMAKISEENFDGVKSVMEILESQDEHIRQLSDLTQHLSKTSNELYSYSHAFLFSAIF
ncbi:hypothetical protein L1765_02865 [Microaerobacter geothermalis]|uniref:hypothetical protein n=1 Tax=Microaerobacter geothermalis TaxID=674972 RepID=UPI001F214B72|nr:hypothetical protein [Microaerobacter geothermalis]MCF6092938.1 hypothetical protein [Microaerobacter geothermalis]